MHRGGACLFQDSGMRVTLAAVLEEVGEGPCDEPSVIQESAEAERMG